MATLWKIIDFLNTYNGAVTAVATIAIGAFTLALVCVTNRQARLTREAIDLGNKEFAATHRPKVRIKHVWSLNEFWWGQTLEIRVVCVNRGTTEARLLQYGADFLIIPEGTSFPADHKWAFQRQISTVLKSGISAPFPELSYVLTEQNEIAVREGRFKFYCAGYVHYADSAESIRTTAFCRELKLDAARRARGHFVPVDNPDYEYED